MITKNKVLDLFDARFDFTSARIVLGDALARAGLSTAKDGLEPDDVRKLAAALGTLGVARVDALAAGLIGLADAAPAGKGRNAPAPDPEPEPEAAVEEAVAEEAPEDSGDEGPKAKAGKGKKR